MKYDYYITGTIGEEFDWWTGQRGTTANMVKEFLDKNKGKELNIAVSSPGGYLDEGITIAEMIAAHGNCNMIIVGMTASAATVLCMKAKSVKIARGSLMLVHNSSQYILGQGMANKQKLDAYIENLRKTRENLDTVDKAIADMYSFRNGKTIEENCAMMDKEKWMTAQEAVDFGIVDAVLEDDETKDKAKAIQNVYASYPGIEEHYFLPQLPQIEKAAAKVPHGIMAKLKDLISGFGGEGEETDGDIQDNKSTKTLTKMKKIIFNLICAVLAIQDITIDEANNAASLTEDQLQKIEDALKAKDDQISALKAEKQKAVDDLTSANEAKATAEQSLADLQKEFDDFKAQAGDDTKLKPEDNEGKENPSNAKNMYNSIKNLM